LLDIETVVEQAAIELNWTCVQRDVRLVHQCVRLHADVECCQLFACTLNVFGCHGTDVESS